MLGSKDTSRFILASGGGDDFLKGRRIESESSEGEFNFFEGLDIRVASRQVS